MRPWKVVLIIGICGSLVASAYFGYRYIAVQKVTSKQLPPLAPVTEKPNPALLSAKTTKRVEPGISDPEKLPSGDTIVTVGGTLLSITNEGPNGVYSLQLSVPYQGNTYTFQVDLGPQHFTIGEEMVTIEDNTKTAKPDDLLITSTAQTKTVEAIYNEYKDRTGEVIGLIIVTDISAASRKNCTATCTERLNFYKKYAANNKLLETPEKINPRILLNLGMVSQITSGGTYGL